MSIVHSVLRRAILAAAESERIHRFVGKHGMRLGAARFVAGETIDEAVPVLRRLNERGLLTNTTLLGEGVRSEAETRVVVDTYRELLDRIQTEALQTNVAVKLTHLGLVLGEELAYANVAELVDHARERGNFIRIDMEESAYVDATLRTYSRTSSAPRRTSKACSTCSPTSASSRGRTWSRPTSRTRGRRTSTPRTSGSSS
jgi:proline dehydrogenase